MTAVRAVVFDVGETLVDETRQWAWWAERLEVPIFTLMAVLGGVIARGEHHSQVFSTLRPNLDLEAMERRRCEGTDRFAFSVEDLYADAMPCLASVRRAGCKVAIAGNQPESTETALRAIGIDLDLIASSARWGVEKPSAAFFARIAAELGLAPAEIAYVGDRIDNDVVPAAAAGMTPVFLRRGPWAFLQETVLDLPAAAVVVDSLDRLVTALSIDATQTIQEPAR